MPRKRRGKPGTRHDARAGGHVQGDTRRDGRVLQGPEEREEVPGMEVIKERRGRVHAGKHSTRPVTVRYRTVPMLTDGQRENLRGCLYLALIAACVAVTGLVEGSPWPYP